MGEFIDIDTTGALGIITLDRSSAINALNQQMIDAIRQALGRWKTDPSIRAVLIEGRGERGFCAGGDVRAARTAIIEGRKAMADAFFASEYAMDAEVAKFGKPVIALTHGVVMGGGLGLSAHASFRFTTRSARFAMPEGAIGFIPDCGVNFVLAKTLPERALHFLLRGEAIGPADALKLGLTDCVIGDDRVSTVRDWLLTAAQAADVDTAITTIMGSEMVDCGPASEVLAADRLIRAYSAGNAREIVRELGVMAAETDLARSALEAILKRCPTSVFATVESYRAAWLALDVDEVVARDTRLAQFMAGRPDFVEGVRAVLVDRDHKPSWSPARVEEVEEAAIREAVRGKRRGLR
jgi:enoyl-CoA hydratase